jgi:hypothetical protein
LASNPISMGHNRGMRRSIARRANYSRFSCINPRHCCVVRLSDSPSCSVSLCANESGRSRAAGGATHDDDEVGTNDPIAKYHEFGTRTIPPRPFLSAAAMRQEHKIHEMMRRTIAATFDRGGRIIEKCVNCFLSCTCSITKARSSPRIFSTRTSNDCDGLAPRGHGFWPSDEARPKRRFLRILAAVRWGLIRRCWPNSATRHFKTGHWPHETWRCKEGLRLNLHSAEIGQ